MPEETKPPQDEADEAIAAEEADAVAAEAAEGAADKPTDAAAEAHEAAEGQEPQLPEYQVEVTDVGTLRKKVTVTVPAEKIEAKRDELYGELRDTAQVPGFRVGHAPRRLIEKRFGKEVGQDVRNTLVGEALGTAIEKADLNALGQPDLDLESIELPASGDLSFSFEVEVAPEFELPELTGIRLTKRTLEVTDERVDEALDQWRRGQARFEPTDEPAEEGDVVTADATISGEGVEDVHRSGLTLRVAPGQIEGLPLVELGETLAGTKAEGTAELTVTAPQAHPNEDWRGKVLTVRIHVSEVRRRVLPDLDDAFAAQYGLDNAAQLREEMRRNLEARVHSEQQQDLRDQLEQYLLENVELEVPEQAAGRQTDRVLRRRYVDLLRRGVPREQIDEYLTELQAAASEQAVRELKLSFILGKICQEKEIDVADEEINAAIAQMARLQDRRPERLRQELDQDGSLEMLAQNLREQKALDELLKTAEISEVDAAAEAQGEREDKAGADREPKAEGQRRSQGPGQEPEESQGQA